MLTELRRYSVLPGAMDAMHARMTDMLLPLFREHGIPHPRAIWENRDDTSVLSWMVDWPSFEARQKGWADFAPLFVAARQAEGTPEIVTRTTLTLVSPWPGSAPGFVAGGDCELAWHVQPRIGFGAAFVDGCLNGAFDLFRGVGASAVNACNFMFGALPEAWVLISWPNAAARAAGMARIAALEMHPGLAISLTGDGPCFGDRGQWETLDRAGYLWG